MFGSIVEAVLYHAEKTPDKLALADDTSEVTYSEYAVMIKKYASVLQDIGIKKSDTVVLEAEQSIAYLALELAIQLTGAVFIPLEHNCSASKILEISDYMNASAIITNQVLETQKSVYGYAALYELMQNAKDSATPALPNENDISEILFSTGTTGKEKGITLCHKNDLCLAENVIYGVGMLKDNVELIPSPMNHSHGLRRYYANMYNGSTVILLGSAMNVRRMFFCLENYRVTAMDLVPTAMTVILRLTKGKLGEYK